MKIIALAALLGFVSVLSLFGQEPVADQKELPSLRSRIEDKFINRLRTIEIRADRRAMCDTAALVPYGDNVDLYVLPGNYYQNRKITDNAYFTVTTDTVTSVCEVIPVWSTDYPLESIANLFVCPDSLHMGQPITLRVLKHEYGVKEEVETTVGAFLTLCTEEGCLPYWGVERYDDGELQGVLIILNPTVGYTHVLTVTCNPLEVIENQAPVRARTSLYVPVNNVENLNAPNIHQSNPERPQYEVQID